MTTLATALDVVITDRLERLEVALPAKIEKYDAATQKADVKPLIHYVTTDRDGLAEHTTPLGVICCVPVVFFSIGGYSLTAPVNVGDFVLLVFCSESLDEWLFSDGRDTDPKDPRRHSINDAIAIPGLRPFSRALPSAQLPHLSLGKEGGLRIHVKDGEICLGEENPSDAVALASKVEAQLAGLRDAILGWTPVLQDGGGALKVALTMFFAGLTTPPQPEDPPAVPTWPASVGSTTVKVKP